MSGKKYIGPISDDQDLVSKKYGEDHFVGGGGTPDDNSITSAKLANASAGDYGSYYDGPLQQTNSQTYNCLFACRVPRGGVYRVKFSLEVSSYNASALARIYVNGSAVGAERTTSSSTSYTVFSEDITVVDGDIIQIYARISTGSYYSKVMNFTVCEADPLIPARV